MSPTAGDGSSKPPQTLTGRIMGAFTGPPSSGGSEAKADPPEVLPPGERKAAMTTLDQMETKWALRRPHSGGRRRNRDPRLLHSGEPPYEGATANTLPSLRTRGWSVASFSCSLSSGSWPSGSGSARLWRSLSSSSASPSPSSSCRSDSPSSFSAAG